MPKVTAMGTIADSLEYFRLQSLEVKQKKETLRAEVAHKTKVADSLTAFYGEVEFNTFEIYTAPGVKEVQVEPVIGKAAVIPQL